MNIAIIGAGAMGALYGGLLSKHNEVSLIDIDTNTIEQINSNGLVLMNNDESHTYYPKAYDPMQDIGPVDLVIVFVKSLLTEEALNTNKSLFDKNTYLMTLQNGFGHEEILRKFVPEDKIIIGTTEDNGAVVSPGVVRYGGNGKANIGLLNGEITDDLITIQKHLNDCGFICNIYDNIQQLRWNKLFTNASLSVVTGILQVPIGYLFQNKHAWNLVSQLVHEAVEVAHSYKITADAELILKDIEAVCINSPKGITSICADIQNGRKTEVDFISGALVKAAAQNNIPVPSHQFVLEMVHALEDKSSLS